LEIFGATFYVLFVLGLIPIITYVTYLVTVRPRVFDVARLDSPASTTSSLGSCYICKRFARFLNKCIFSRSALVRSVTLFSINFGRYNSLIYRNLCTVCKLFNWSIHDYISGRVCLSQRFFAAYYKSRLSVGESTTVSFMSELLKLRDNYLYFSGDFHLDQVDIATLIDYVATSTV